MRDFEREKEQPKKTRDIDRNREKPERSQREE